MTCFDCRWKLLGLHFDQNRGFVTAKGFVVPSDRIVVKGQIPCQVCFPWVEAVFTLVDPPASAGSSIYLCLSLDDWALDPMLEVHIDTEGGEHSMPFLKDTSRYELHRMIPFGRAVSYCFAASADGTPGTTPMYFTVDSAPSINLRDLKASDLCTLCTV